MGGATKKVPVKYCKKKTENKNACYLGKTEQLLGYLNDNKEATDTIGIKEMTNNGFVATGKDGKGDKAEKTFTMEQKKEYVVYKKEGWETMGCCKLKDQFVKECEFVGKGEFIECK